MLWHCWLVVKKGIQPVKNWVLVCWWWWFDLIWFSFARLIAPVVTTHLHHHWYIGYRLTSVVESDFPFNALTLLVGRQEGHLACIKLAVGLLVVTDSSDVTSLITALIGWELNCGSGGNLGQQVKSPNRYPSWQQFVTSSSPSSFVFTVTMGYVRSAGICCLWSDDVQRSVRWAMRSRSQHNNIRGQSMKTPFLCLSARLAH